MVNLAGVLLERGTRTPMAGVVVTVFRDDGVQGAVGFEAATVADGSFTFYDLAPGEWRVLAEPPGYYPFRTTETVPPGQRVDVTYYLEKGSYNPYDVTVTAERPRKEVSRTVIEAEEIDKVPGGAGDPLSVVLNFAGVARTQTPALLIVRGSAPEDSRTFIDGATVPLLYHFGGLKSVVPVGILESIEFYPGNFSPMYGRATGGIIDVKIKELKPERMHGYADVSILDTGVYLEVPIGKKGAVAVAGRRSYIDGVLNLAVPDDAPVSLVTAPVYYDLQVLGNYRPTPAHDLRGLFLFSDDRLELLFDNPADLDPALEGNRFETHTGFYRTLFTYRFVPDKSFENTLRVSQGRDEILFGAGQLELRPRALHRAAARHGSPPVRRPLRAELRRRRPLHPGGRPHQLPAAAQGGRAAGRRLRHHRAGDHRRRGRALLVSRRLRRGRAQAGPGAAHPARSARRLFPAGRRELAAAAGHRALAAERSAHPQGGRRSVRPGA